MQEKNIGKLIAESREKKGLSQRQLAKIAKISNAELSKIESGEREIPNPKTLRKISNIIDVIKKQIDKNKELLKYFSINSSRKNPTVAAGSVAITKYIKSLNE